MSTQHTKGPWEVKGNTIWGLVPDEGYGLSRPERHRIVANTSSANNDGADQANAHLIAAAPAMYEALKEAATALDGLVNYSLIQGLNQAEKNTLNALIRDMRQVLDQAEGKG